MKLWIGVHLGLAFAGALLGMTATSRWGLGATVGFFVGLSAAAGARRALRRAMDA